MTVVQKAISRMVSAKVRLRPMRSPTTPKTIPPIGRRAKATAKTAKVFILDCWLAPGEEAFRQYRCKEAVYAEVKPLDEVADCRCT
jgi:hypothetical protein